MHSFMQLDGMKKQIWIVVALVLMHMLCCNMSTDIHYRADSVLPKYYVDDDYNSSTPGWQVDHFHRIQDAINTSSVGERIIVYEGTYFEHISINKSIDIFGEDGETTIIDGSGSGSVVTIDAKYVDFSTFTIQNAGENSSDAGIYITSNSGYCHIVENIITDCVLGIYLDHCDDNVIAQNDISSTINATFLITSNRNSIEYNTIYENSQHGVFLNETCSNNTIQYNQIYDNGIHGVYLNDQCRDNAINHNTVYENQNTGIRIEDYSSFITISDNTIYSNENYGIMIVGSSNTILNNFVTENVKHGIFLFADDNTSVSSNNVSLNLKDGIRLQNSTDCIIRSNAVIKNERYGIYINYYSLENLIYDNFFSGNDQHAKDISTSFSNNVWYIEKTAGSNIINGPFFAGNFWEDYIGIDNNRDGVGEISYSVDGGNKIDEYPLMYRRPVANASGPYFGCVQEKIVFDASDSFDYNENLTLTYSWVFGDGETKEGKKVTHSFSEKGNYTVELFVTNEVGGMDSDISYVIITPDSLPPIISIEAREFVSSSSATLFTIRAHIVDNVKVYNVSIEYWFDNQTSHITAQLNKISNDRYEKTIILSESADEIHCFLKAVDISGNENITLNPFSVFTSVEKVDVSENILFDGTDSFDLDGTIESFVWDFGDGVSKNGDSVLHSYATDGTYVCKLTVTDNDGYIGVSKKTIVVAPPVPLEASSSVLTEINDNSEIDVSLAEPFICYDTDGDGFVDMFVDPNGVLTLVTNVVMIGDEPVFLLSVDDGLIPECLWMPESDSISWVDHVIPSFSDEDVTIDYEASEASLSISLNKSGWILIDLSDTLYPNADIKSVRDVTHDIVIPLEQVWRKEDHIFILDDPGMIYEIVFEDIFPPIDVTFSPSDSGVIGETSPTILIEYNVPVVIQYAYFNSLSVGSQIKKIDDQTYQYTPPGYLKNGTYTFEVQVQALYGSEIDTSGVTYFYFQYETPPQPTFLEKFGLYLLVIGIFGAGGLFYGICRYKGLKFNSYIYVKNRAIIPFIRPVIFGPMSVSIDDSSVSKAEFYIDGALMKTVSKAPFVWQWNESAFLYHRVTAKVFDRNGNNFDSGEMSVFIINPFKMNDLDDAATSK